ncbi:hypothetical protein Tco_0506119 [Tanacetum coccineum]
MIGELTYFLGLKIKQDDKGISICQEQYTRNLLKKYEIFDSSLVKTPMVPRNNLDPDLAGKPVNETSYREMISVGSSNANALVSPYLLVLIIGTSQSRQQESRKSPTAELFDVDSGRISIHHCDTKEYHSECSSNYHKDNA